MSDAKEFARFISLLVGGLIYVWIWFWSIDHAKNCNRNAIWEVLCARAFIGLHIGALLVFCVWGWK